MVPAQCLPFNAGFGLSFQEFYFATGPPGPSFLTDVRTAGWQLEPTSLMHPLLQAREYFNSGHPRPTGLDGWVQGTPPTQGGGGCRKVGSGSIVEGDGTTVP